MHFFHLTIYFTILIFDMQKRVFQAGLLINNELFGYFSQK